MYDSILLDTCALIWLASGDDRLTPSTLSMIAQANHVYLSAITGFEISIKYAKNKLVLPMPPEQWLAQIINYYQLSILPLDIGICSQSAQLPFHHNDPCDRFIIATAMSYQLPVMTGDSKFADYPISVIHV